MRPRKTCPCGGVCKGNKVRCAQNVQLQARAREAVERRRAAVHVVEEPGDSIADVLLRVCEARC